MNQSSDVDEAIDAVARSLTAGAPDDGFRARVVARMSDRKAFPLFRLENDSRPLFWFLPAAAVIVVAVLVVSVAERARHDVASRPPGATAQPLQSKSIPLAAANRSKPSAPPDSARGRARLRTTESAVAALAPRPLEPPSIALEPLPAPDVAQIDSIQLSTLTVPSIDLAPLPSENSSDMRRPQ